MNSKWSIGLAIFLLTQLTMSVHGTGIPYTPNPSNDYLVPLYDELPFKDQRGSESWSSTINAGYSPDEDWDTDFSDNGPDGAISFKCLSYAASSANDWLNLQYGLPMQEYKDVIHGNTGEGTNPRFLEAVYHTREGQNYLYSYTPLFSVLLGVFYGPITNERIPYRLEGFADILTNPPQNWIHYEDPLLGNSKEFNYTYADELFNAGTFKQISVVNELFRGSLDENRLKHALEKYGVLLSFTERLNSPVNIHSMALVGHGEDGNGVFFIGHDNYGSGGTGDFSEYKKLYIEDIDQAFAFIPEKDWSTFHHDNRRTGFTLLKGDLTSASKVRKTEWTLDSSSAPGAIAHPSIADLDRNGKQEIVVTTSDYTDPYDGDIYSVEKGFFSFSEKWNKNIGMPIPKAPSIANIDSDDQLEISFGDRGLGRNSTLHVLDGEDGSTEWTYELEPKYSSYLDDYFSGLISNTVMVDIDLDGEKEILFNDKEDTDCGWPGELFVFDKDGNLEYSVSVGNDGSEGGPSIADIFGSGYPDVIVPTKCGIKAYEFTGSGFILKWSTSDARIDGNAVIYDVDRDGAYEVIYTTADYACPFGESCDNQLFIRDAETGNNEANSPIDLGAYVSRVTPAIADIRGSDNPEIIITARDSSASEYGRVLCYDAVTGSACGGNWPYTKGGTLETFFQAAAIVDIDGDGSYNVIFGAEDNKTYFLDEDGDLLFSYQFDGQLGSSPAIGDIDNDGRAEIAIRNEGSNILTELGGANYQPHLVNISNITADAGDLLFINATGEVTASDFDNDTLDFFYSSPFNNSGHWQTGINDSGNYSVLVEVSDGNLSDWTYIAVEVIGPVDILPPSITIQSPRSGISYRNETSISLNWTTDETVDWCAFSLDGGENDTSICQKEIFEDRTFVNDIIPAARDITLGANTIFGVGFYGSNPIVEEYTYSGVSTGFNFSVANETFSPTGITWNGSHLFVIENQHDKVFSYHPGGEYTGFNFSVSEFSNPQGITWNGSHFLVSGAFTSVHAYTPDGTPDSTFSTSGNGEKIVFKSGRLYFRESGNTVSVYYTNGTNAGYSIEIPIVSSLGGMAFIESQVLIVNASSSGLIPSKLYRYNHGKMKVNLSVGELSTGNHNLTLWANDSTGNRGYAEVSFFVTNGSTLSLATGQNPYVNMNKTILVFDIMNNGSESTGANWSVDFGDNSTAVNTNSIILNSEGSIRGFAEHEYVQNGTFETGIFVHPGDLFIQHTVQVGGNSPLEIPLFNEAFSLGKEKVLNALITNAGIANLSNLNWNIEGLGTVLDSSEPFSLGANKTVRMFVGANLSVYGDYQATLNASSVQFQSSSILKLRGKELEIDSVRKIGTDGLNATLTILVYNTFNQSLSGINWTLDTGAGSVQSQYPINLSAGNHTRVFIQYTYPGSGSYHANASAAAVEYADWENTTVII